MTGENRGAFGLVSSTSHLEREISMRTTPIGVQGPFAFVVSPEKLANRFKDATVPAVLATPVMIMAMENPP